MQNTNIENLTGSASAIKEPKKHAEPLPKMKLELVSDAYAIKQPELGFFKKIVRFLFRLFGYKTQILAPELPTIQLAAPVEPQTIRLQEKQMEKPVVRQEELPSLPTVNTPAEPILPPVRHNDIVRRIAEQQFVNMDPTQATRN
jgi:hypothetical protein